MEEIKIESSIGKGEWQERIYFARKKDEGFNYWDYWNGRNPL